MPDPVRTPRRCVTSWTSRLRLALLIAVAAAVPGAPLVAQQDRFPSPESLAKAAVDALSDQDAEALAGLVDFSAWSAEGRLRGTALVDWERLDEAQRAAQRVDVARSWMDDDPVFLRSASIFDFRRVDDPDAGQGPVPGRIIVQLDLKSPLRGRHRDLLVYVTPDHRLIELIFGPPHEPDADPHGPEGLLPLSITRPVEVRIRWPDDVATFEREDARELVQWLLDAEDAAAVERVIESLHRDPYLGTAALLERLMDLDAGGAPGVGDVGRVVLALETVTGRHGGLDLTAADSDWPPRVRAELLSWLRWHERHGSDFEPAPIVDPIERTFAERGLDDFPPRGATGSARPADDDPVDAAAEAGDGLVAGLAPPPATGVDAPAPPSGADGEPDPVSGGVPAIPAAPPGGPPPGAEGTGAADEPGSERPKVRFRTPEPAAPVIPEDRDVDELTLLLVPPDSSSSWNTVAEVRDRLDPAVLEALDRWAPIATAIDGVFAYGGRPEVLVLGRRDEAELESALEVLHRTHALIDPLVPRQEGRPLRPVVAVLTDPELMRGPAWDRLVFGLVEARLLAFDAAGSLADDPRGFTNRTESLLVQPTRDMVGNAAAGDDEFRRDNELAHKLAGCLAANRAGFLPGGVIWALGHLAEVRLFQSVYQFNKSGFVAVGDHFDWPGQARRVLEKQARKSRFDLAQAFLESGAASDSIDGHLVGWAVIEYWAAERPMDLATWFGDLAELHKEARPYGGGKGYEGDHERTLASFHLRLGADPVDAILRHLRRLD